MTKRYTDTKEAARKRYDQAMISADIEGLSRDPEAEALVDAWDREGVPQDEQIKRLKEFYKQRQLTSAAE